MNKIKWSCVNLRAGSLGRVAVAGSDALARAGSGGDGGLEGDGRVGHGRDAAGDGDHGGAGLLGSGPGSRRHGGSLRRNRVRAALNWGLLWVLGSRLRLLRIFRSGLRLLGVLRSGLGLLGVFGSGLGLLRLLRVVTSWDRLLRNWLLGDGVAWLLGLLGGLSGDGLLDGVLRSVWAFGHLRAAGGDGDLLGLVNDLLRSGGGNGQPGEESGRSERETHRDGVVLFCFGFFVKSK